MAARRRGSKDAPQAWRDAAIGSVLEKPSVYANAFWIFAGAGSGDGTPFNLDNFILTVQINLIGTFNVCRLAASRMVGNEPNESGQ